MNSSGNNSTPAQQLVGKKLHDGWTVEQLINQSENATGGHFSTAYVVRSADGKKAFLKAMDYKKALESKDPARELQAMTAAFNFERDLLEKCRSKGLSRVVTVITSGKLPPQDNDVSTVVEYLIFELANGDIRSFISFESAFETAWAIRTMHQAAAALRQLHSAQIAHQDVKPSNVLCFSNQHTKLADLGRASDRDRTSPHDELDFAGDRTYAPPELLYGHVPEDWNRRRLGSDLYMLGSLVLFLCVQVSMTHLIFKRLNKEHRWLNWGGNYKEVLPYIQSAFAEIIRDLRKQITTEFADEIPELVKQLCNPDPDRRGDPKNIRLGNQYSLERYVSIFDRLALTAEWSLKHKDPISLRNNDGNI